MPGIFGGHIFDGLGQAADMTFTLEETEAAASGPKAGGAAFIPGSSTGGKVSTTAPAYIPGAPVPSASLTTSVAPATSSNTMLYVVGGVAVVGILAAVMMSGGRRGTVAANKRGRRGRRSRARRSR